MRLTRRCVFSASHRLAGPYSHGHNYTLEVVVEGEPDRESGMVLDLKVLKDRIAAEVEERFDHKDLNDDTPYFRDRPPTAEHVATVIFDLLAGALGPHRLVAVRLSPDERLTVEVSR